MDHSFGPQSFGSQLRAQIRTTESMPSARTAKRCHFALTALYGALSMFIFLVPFVFLNYTVTFQMTTLATVHLLTGILVAQLVLYAALRALYTRQHAASPLLAIPGESAPDRQRRMLALADATMLETYRRMAIAITVIVIITLVAVGFYLYNLIYILAVKCPCYAPQPNVTLLEEHPHTQDGLVFRGVDKGRVQHADTLDVMVTLNDAAAGVQHLLMLKYNVTQREILHHSGPLSAPMTWSQRQLDALEHEPVCSHSNFSRFYHLESEIQDALAQRLLQHQQRQSVLIRGHDNNVQTNQIENHLFLELMARYICRNEYGFAAGLIGLLLGVLVLNFVTMGWFLGLRRTRQ